MSRTIEGQGWFVWFVSGLVAADEAFIREYLEEGAPCPYNLEMLREELGVVSSMGIARTSRKGWATVDHQVLGTLQWKSGYNFRNAQPYLLLMVGGRLIIDQNQQGSRDAADVWLAPNVSEGVRRRVGWKLTTKK